jgi:CRISPR-associated protein Cas1
MRKRWRFSHPGMSTPPLIPARILNEHVYCPRLAYIEWVGREFADNADTAEGTLLHRRTDRRRGRPPAPADADVSSGAIEGSTRSTSVEVGSERLGLVAKIDVLEADDGWVIPVETKRGRPRDGESPLWEPELVQLAAQAMILRDAGYRVRHAEVFFGETRTRHRIELPESLESRALAAASELRANAARTVPPAPLVDSPKCPRCSLVGICLPDEVNLVSNATAKPPRRLIARDPPAEPLYATTQGSRLTKRRGRVILLEHGEEVASRRLLDISHVAVFGNVDVGSALLRECFDAGVPVLWLTMGGWLSGAAIGMPSRNVVLRMRQHRAAALGAGAIASAIVAGKLRNQRTLLRRHGDQDARAAVQQLARLARSAEQERDASSLLGIEGTGARLYFERFGRLLRPPSGGNSMAFAFEERNRRPPRDPVNALLSFLYAMLTKDAVAALMAVGLDPYVGLYHRAGFGRPALALDLIEELRPLVGDSTVLMAVNNGEVSERDFVERAGGVWLTPAGRRKVIAAYERRMKTELRHPLFGYRASYRRALEIQARLLGAVLVGSAPSYRPLTTR